MIYRTGLSGLAGRLTFCRSISGTHSLPVNQTLEILRATNADFEGLFTHKALNELWFKQGEQLIQNLNQHIAQSAGLLEHSADHEPTVEELLAITTNKPHLHNVHKAAGRLYALTSFFENLRPMQTPLSPVKIERPSQEALFQTPTDDFINQPTDPNLVAWISSSFGSVKEFRNLLINTAKAVKGDGTVWLVAQSKFSHSNRPGASQQDYHHHPNHPNHHASPSFSELALVVTYNGGVVHDVERAGQLSRMREIFKDKERMAKDEEEVGESKSEKTTEALKSKKEVNELQLGSVQEAEDRVAFSNRKLIPALAIDASPRTYLVDYGVYGKQKYLENCWECIDWDVVMRRLPERMHQKFVM
ncbi:hypothetical protein PVL30_003744 [Lodderomyces elongisporus]|uniref:Manganese/iron superoxide dismutase C-terminal domain-containing protein n=1 Tax=Lodderomyces elongisporus (strain ATCC 11503 / CBS 2605 / JCM 1781 / NBRC 1676 / NRRL YB-4239) TaxID=379508 RepID=A5DZX3_LODEL|nr:uncharacterized protein PVL30_003744 [Lodderomyces elongisporus]EDK44731.1 hypothetical protein LELG_02910 [Lodderomyces elongisporus NRRL YB-4239]WLF79977.1 hypothetical protein PVL30_003744 [Lodderomyces elongisporus]